MPILADCHLHSNFSGDSEASMESMIKQAIAKGLKTICFTEHNDFNYPAPAPEQVPPRFRDNPSGIFELNGDSYLFDLIKFRERYMGQIEVLFGVELGLQKEIMRRNIKFVRDYDFDFVIGSIHIVHGKDPYSCPEYFDGRSDEEAYREYFETAIENLKSFSNFDSFGHLDYIIRYGRTKDENYSYAKYSDLIDQILRLIIDREKALEINTAGLASGLKDMNPCFDILKRYKELGGELVTVGSDAHSPERIAYGFDRAYEALKECGFKYYTVFCGRSPEQRKLL